MFHRANAGAIKPQSKQQAEAQFKVRDNAPKTGMEQTAVKPYQGPQEEGYVAPQYVGAPKGQSQVGMVRQKKVNDLNTKLKIQTMTKEEKAMNNPQTKNQSQENQQQPTAPAQPRVDIPGNNFQRPGISSGVAAQAGRPSYPGASYPGATAPSNNQNYNPQPAQREQGRMLSIGQGITMSGEIEACDHLVVEGTVEAALKGANILDIAESGAFYGTVEIEEATIAGRFEGDITVRGRLTIESTGIVIGSISYKELAIEAGATMDGSVSPIGSENAGQRNQGGKKSSPKAKKVSQNNHGAELPFSDRAAAE